MKQGSVPLQKRDKPSLDLVDKYIYAHKGLWEPLFF